MEAIFAVTPSETIKYVSLACYSRHPSPLHTPRTKLIDDAKRPNPQYRGLIHGTASIIKQEGFRGIYGGLFPVVSFPPLYSNTNSQSQVMLTSFRYSLSDDAPRG